MSSSKHARWYGAKNGVCNICGKLDQLTEDHVPPKGSIETTTRDLANFAHYIGNEKVRYVHMQNGVKFRSLCQKCNNELLGKQYDPHLNALSKEAASLLRAAQYLYVPWKSQVRIYPQRIARAVVGHLLAAEIRDNMADPAISAPFQNAMRAYFLDPSAPMPDNLDIRYWIYAGDYQIIMRSFGIGIPGKGVLVCDMLKYFPLAFLVIFNSNPKHLHGLHSLVSEREMNIDDQIDFALNLSARKRIDWPERPDDHEVILLNDSFAYIATERKKGKQEGCFASKPIRLFNGPTLLE